MNSTNKEVGKKWLIFFAYISVLLTIIVLAYVGILPVKISFIPFYDTIGHFMLLGMTGYLLHRALRRKVAKVFNYFVPIGPVIVGTFAVIEENLQRFSPNRTYDIMDLAANLSGIIFFYWLDSVLPPLK